MRDRFLYYIFIFLLFLFSCGEKQKKSAKLSMSSDEMVDLLIDMYCINAAININDFTYRDSTTQVYYAQLSEISGKSMDDIKSEFEKLLLMEDSLAVFQNRALDTLRSWQEKSFVNPAVNIGIN